MTYSSSSVTTFNPSLNCERCAGEGYVSIYKFSWRTNFCVVCPDCKGTGEPQTKKEDMKMADWNVNKHVFLHNDNAEEILSDCIGLIKSKAYSESRKQAFEDCTNFWKERIDNLLKENLTEVEKLLEIRKMFGIKIIKESD